MNRVKRGMLACMLAIVLTTLLTAGVVQAAGQTGAKWRVVKSPNVGPNDNLLFGVATISTNNIWAVGDYTDSNGVDQTLIEHWNGTRWKVVASPSPSVYYNELRGVAAVSANDIWTVGYAQGGDGGNYGTLIEYWNGTSWGGSSSPNPGQNNYLHGVVAVSATDVWAVGYSQNAGAPSQTLIEHWNGTSWQVVSSPNLGSLDNRLLGVAAVSASNIWAVGDYTNSNAPDQTLIEHWNGTSWQVVSSPNLGSSTNQLLGVAVVSAKNVWAVGDQNGQTLIEHWNGTSWQVVSSPSPGLIDNGLRGVAVVSASNIWAVGYSQGVGGGTLIEHWNGSSWKVVASPASNGYLQGVARVPGRSTLWAVGEDGGSSGSFQTLTEFYS